MNNLEKLKEINPFLYEKIKIKYLTNAEGVKNSVDSLSFEEFEKQIKDLETIDDLKNLEMKINTYYDILEMIKSDINSGKFYE
jgi:hypothetical protein